MNVFRMFQRGELTPDARLFGIAAHLYLPTWPLSVCLSPDLSRRVKTARHPDDPWHKDRLSRIGVVCLSRMLANVELCVGLPYQQPYTISAAIFQNALCHYREMLARDTLSMPERTEVQEHAEARWKLYGLGTGCDESTDPAPLQPVASGRVRKIDLGD